MVEAARVVGRGARFPRRVRSIMISRIAVFGITCLLTAMTTFAAAQGSAQTLKGGQRSLTHTCRNPSVPGAQSASVVHTVAASQVPPLISLQTVCPS